MKYPTFEQYEYFERFRSRWILDEPSTGCYVARPRGMQLNEYQAVTTRPGIWTFESGLRGVDIFAEKHRPIYCRSLDDFGWKLMCYLVREGKLEPE